MKRILSLLTVIALSISMIASFPIVTSAETLIYDNLLYVVSEGEVMVTGYDEVSSSVEIPVQIEGYPVTGIGERAFYNCADLTSIKIPADIKSIGWRAFWGCSSLEIVWFCGSDSQKETMTIGEGNEILSSVTWYNNICTTHSFDTDCDDTCNLCIYTRSIMHIYDDALNAICNVCGGARNITVMLKKDISNASINGLETSYKYTGDPIEPEISVSLGGEELIYLTDYEIRYYNNTQANSSPYVRVIGIGEYVGYVDKSFEIELGVTRPSVTTYRVRLETGGGWRDYMGSGNMINPYTHYTPIPLSDQNLHFNFDGRSPRYELWKGNSLVRSENANQATIDFASMESGTYVLNYSSYTGGHYVNGVLVGGELTSGSVSINNAGRTPAPRIPDPTEPEYLEAGIPLINDVKYLYLSVVAQPDACLDNITWSSSDESVATVADGIVELKKSGFSKITAEVYGKSTYWELEVVPLDIGKAQVLYEKSQKSFCVVYQGECLIEGVDYTITEDLEENIKKIKFEGCGLFNGLIEEFIDQEANELYPCSHTYDHVCDAECNKCMGIRYVPHIYTTVCDADCNLCGEVREGISHEYHNGCDAICNKCGLAREIEHIYTDACDAFCNECGEKRTISGHRYSNDCDTTCNLCGTVREVGAHRYTNSCDTDCNICGAERTITHSYTHGCDAVCNVCGETREIAGHSYTNDCDIICNTCGATRSTSHVYNRYIYNDDATCAKDGTKLVTCSVCGYIKETVTAKGTQLKDSSVIFKDVPSGVWYKHYIDYAVTHKILNGTGTSMEPERTMTRAEFVQVLANLSGIDTSNKQVNTGYEDVKAGTWYAPAVKWASENGIVNGVGEKQFAPEDKITREQMCTMLVRYIEGYLGITFVYKIDGQVFSDDAEISDWAKSSVYKCQMVGLVNGVSETEFAPGENADRASVATIITRYHLEYINN